MNTKNLPAPEAAAIRCPLCGRIDDAGGITPIGVFEGVEGIQPLILYQCRCKTTRAIYWEEASERLREKAREAQRSRATSREEDRR